MIAEIGLAALWLAAGLCALQFIAGVLGVREAGADGAVHPVSALARPAAVVQGLLLLVAFACLLRVFAVTDLSVALVADNSHVDKPFIYRLSAAWGNHEGSMLLWVTILGLSGGLVALFERRMDDRFMKAVLAAQAFIALGFLAFLLFSSNPFARLNPPADFGAGLNPLLQDIGLAFHPPTLYLGYVGLSVAFSFVVAGLVTRQAGPELARVMRPWVLAAWVALTLGAPAAVFTVAEALATDTGWVILTSALLHAPFYFYVSYSMVRYVFHDDRVTRDELYATGAAFTVVAWGFAYVYAAVQVVWPDSFAGAGTEGARSWFELLYLSFSVLTSVGLSDVVPVGAHARSLVAVEMVAGVLYVALVVSRLVGLVVSRQAMKAVDDRPDEG